MDTYVFNPDRWPFLYEYGFIKGVFRKGHCDTLDSPPLSATLSGGESMYSTFTSWIYVFIFM